MVRERFKDHFQPSLDWRKCKFTWLGTTKPLMRSRSSSAPTNTASFACTPIRSKKAWARSSWSAGKRRGSGRDWTQRARTNGRVHARALRGPSRGSRAADQPLDLAHLSDRAQRHVVPRQRRAGRRLRAYGALLDRLRHQAGDGRRDGPARPPSSSTAPTGGGSARRLSGRPLGRCAEGPESRPDEPRVVRELGPLPRAGSRDLLLQPHDAVEADHLRQPRAP